MLRLSKANLQDLYLALLLRASAPIDGQAIVNWLIEHGDMWSAAICGRMPQKIFAKDSRGGHLTIRTPGTLRHVRGLAFGKWDADSLWLLPSELKGAATALVEQAAAWGAVVRVGADAGEVHTPYDLIGYKWAVPNLQAKPMPAEPPELPLEGEDPGLLDMSPAAICLELIRRTKFNDFDGDRIAKDLREHRDLWKGAVLGIGDSVFVEKGQRVHSSPQFNTLECLPAEEQEGHNADTMWVVCPSVEAARELVKLSHKGWKVYPNSTLIWNKANSQRTAGCIGEERAVSFWWD